MTRAGQDPAADPEADEDWDARSGAVDNDFDDALRDPLEQLQENMKEATGGYHAVPRPGDVAIDLATRQIVYVDEVLAETVVEYFDDQDFDLWSYKSHPYLPVRHDDTVYGVIYVGRDVESVHKAGKIYPTPRGRLARVPVELAEAMR